MRMNWGRVQGRPLAWHSMNGGYCGHCFVVAQPCAMESHLEETTWTLKVLKGSGARECHSNRSWPALRLLKRKVWSSDRADFPAAPQHHPEEGSPGCQAWSNHAQAASAQTHCLGSETVPSRLPPKSPGALPQVLSA